MNIIEWIIENKFAKNRFEAAHIANGLKLAEIRDNPELQQRRVRLYRDWRTSEVYGKQTAPCYEKAIAGEEVAKLELTETAAE